MQCTTVLIQQHCSAIFQLETGSQCSAPQKTGIPRRQEEVELAMSAPGRHLPMVQSHYNRGAVEGRPAVHLQPLNATSTGKQGKCAKGHGKTI